MNLARCLRPKGKSNVLGKMRKEKQVERNTENYVEWKLAYAVPVFKKGKNKDTCQSH